MLDFAHCMTYFGYNTSEIDSSPLPGLSCHYIQLAGDFFGGDFKICGNGYNLKQKHLNIQWPGSNLELFLNGQISGTMPDSHPQKQNK